MVFGSKRPHTRGLQEILILRVLDNPDCPVNLPRFAHGITWDSKVRLNCFLAIGLDNYYSIVLEPGLNVEYLPKAMQNDS